MEPLEQGTIEETAAYAPDHRGGGMSYPELCSALLTALARAVKNAALYGLAHPVVIDSLNKNMALLGLIFRYKGEKSLTISFMTDVWLFNETAVPALTQESQNLNAFFKAHRLTGLTFLSGVQPFELGVLCEFLATQARNLPENHIEEFFSGKGVLHIKTVAVHYVKEGVYSQQAPGGAAAGTGNQGGAGGFPGPRPAPQAPKAQGPGAAPAQRYLKPEAAPRQAQPAQAPRVQPAGQPRQAAPPPAAPAQAAGAKVPGTGGGAGHGTGTGGHDGADEALFGQRPRATVTASGKATGGAADALFGEPRPATQKPVSAAGAGTAQSPAQSGGPAGMSYGGILKGLVESSLKDPKERVKAYEDALKSINESMQQQIADATRALTEKKEHVVSTQSRTERVLSKVADGKIIVDKDGKILMMNPAAEEIAGTKLADAVGKHISERLKPGEHFLTLSSDMDLSKGKLISGEVEVQGDEMMGRALRRSVALLVDGEDRVVGAFSTLPEITKYKEAQRMQEEFLSRITHDLQSPLSSITSALEMLTDAAGLKLDPTENKFLDISIRNSHRLSQMIKGILDFSKLQSGKLDMHPKPTIMAPIMAEATEGLMPWAKTKGVTLSVRPVPEDLCALADAPRIVQVLTNLISNAIKATPEGGIVTVAAACNPGEEGGVLFGVRDTGHGIPREELDKVFEKFVQLSSYETQEGVGLGLAIVRDFVKMHGGRIWVESEEGKGTTFYFTLQPANASCPVF